MGIVPDSEMGISKVNPGSPVTGTPIPIANNLTEGTYAVPLDMTGIRGYFLQYMEVTAAATMDFQMRANASMGYMNIGAQIVLATDASGYKVVAPDWSWGVSSCVPLLPDGQVVIAVAATGHCTAWLIPVPA